MPVSPRSAGCCGGASSMRRPSCSTSDAEAAILAEQDDPDRYYRDCLLHERVAVDLQYLANVSVGQDIRILVRTSLLVLSGLGLLPARASREPSPASALSEGAQPGALGVGVQ